jgi:hypothetical protein
LFLFMVVGAIGLGCSHARPQVERRIYVISEEAPGIGGSGGHDCEQEQIDCFDRCWNAKERPYPHVKRDEWYYKYCTKKCREEYLECLKEVEKAVGEKSELRFTRMDAALDWLGKHKTELVVGTVVVVAGVVFVIATGGSGALILVPVVL